MNILTRPGFNKSRTPRRWLCACSALALLSSPLTVTAKEEWLPLLPEQTIGVITINNVPELLAGWDQSPLARFLADPAVRKWLEPLYADGVAPWDQLAMEAGGGSVLEHFAHYTGASLLAIVWPESEAATEITYAGLSELTDTGANITRQIDARWEKQMAAKPKLEKGESTIQGVTVSHLARGKKWMDAYAQVGGVLIESNDKKIMTQLIAALSSNGGQSRAPGAVGANLKRFREVTGSAADVSLYLDGTVLHARLSAMLAEMEEGRAQAENPFSAQTILDAFSLNEIHGFGVALDFGNRASQVDMALMHQENPQGFLVKMMHGSDANVVMPAFIPRGMDSASVSRWSLLDFYDSILNSLNRLNPMIGGMVQMQLGMAEQQMGFKLRDDLFALTDNEIVQAGRVMEQDGQMAQVVAIKLRDSERFGKSIEIIKKLAGSGADLLEESTVAGFKVWTLKALPIPGSEAAGQTQIAYAIARDQFLVSTGSPDVLNEVLKRLAEGSGDSFWQDAGVQKAVAALPPNATGVAVTEGSALLRMLLATLMSAQSTMAKSAAEGADIPASKLPELDFKTFPEEAFAKYFGKITSGSYSHKGAAHYRVISLPAE